MGVRHLGVPKHVHARTHAQRGGGGGGRRGGNCVVLNFYFCLTTALSLVIIPIPMLSISANLVTVTSNVCFRPDSYRVAVISLVFSF